MRTIRDASDLFHQQDEIAKAKVRNGLVHRNLSAEGDTMGPLDFKPGEVLNDVLQSIRLRSAIYCRATMSGDWGFQVARRDHARFHFVKSGHCWIEAKRTPEPILLGAGDLVVLTDGQGHVLRADPQSPVEPLTDLLTRFPLDEKRNFVWEKGGSATVLLCGGFRLEEQRSNPLLASLPPVLLVRDGMSAGISLRAAFELAETEMMAADMGSEALIARMSDVIFLQAIRASFAADCARAPGLIRGLCDPAIGRVLAAMHRRPERRWTVEILAREVAMSRSSFCERFAELVGEPPMTYLARWRLNRAAFWLRWGRMKILEVAAAVGYDSEVSLSRAFKRCFGISPGAYRRHHAVANGNGGSRVSSVESELLYPSDFRSNGAVRDGILSKS